jgi:hypothetical protein
MTVTHRMDDRYIENAWKRAETSEIEKLASELVDKAQEHGVELDLSRVLYLAFRCGFITGIG